MTCPLTCRLSRAVYTGTRPGLTTAITAGKGWRGRRELAPRCSATQFAARRHDPGQTRRVLNHLNHTHHTSHTNTNTTHDDTTTHNTQNAHPTHTISTYTTHTLNTHAQPFQHTRTTHDRHTHTHSYTHTTLTPHISTQHQHNRQPTVILRRKKVNAWKCAPTHHRHCSCTRYKSVISVTSVISCGHYCFWNE